MPRIIFALTLALTTLAALTKLAVVGFVLWLAYTLVMHFVGA